MLAYDDVKAIRYFARDLRAYWRRGGTSMEQLLVTAAREHDTRSSPGARLRHGARERPDGGRRREYAAIAALAYRQTLAPEAGR